MESFEDLGLSPELVEALAAEGFERPTSLQETAIPVLRRGNNLLIAAAPGSGTLLSWGVAVLDGFEPADTGPRVLVLTPTADAAQRLAESLQRLAVAVGASVAALGSPWALPTRADILFGTPSAVLAARKSGDLDLSSMATLVLDQADRTERLSGLDEVEDLFGFIPKEGQRVVIALPVTPAVSSLVERHARRAATVPPRAAGSAASEPSPRRGTFRFRVVGEPKDEGLLETVSELLLQEEARHVLVFCRSEDRAADMGDYLTLHGFVAGAPGDASVPVWLGVEELSALSDTEGTEGLAVVSFDAPTDPDSLDRRHGHGRGGVVIALPREMTHLRDVAKRTGFSLASFPLKSTPADAAEEFRDLLAKAVEDEDCAPYMLLLEPLFERYAPAEVAAAAAALLRRKTAPTASGASASPATRDERAPTKWVKLFLSVGEKEDLTPKDLLGAITGEASVPGSGVGKIDIRESHTVVEVQETIAAKVISALNGTTIRGRSVRADYDRGRGRGAAPRGRGPRRG